MVLHLMIGHFCSGCQGSLSLFMRDSPNAGCKTNGEGHKTKGGRNEKEDGKEDLGMFYCAGMHEHDSDRAGDRFCQKADPEICPF